MKPILPSDTVVHFNWRESDDAERMFALHTQVVAKTPAGMVRPDTLEHFQRHTGAWGETVACFLDNEELVAYGVLGLDSPTVSHLAHMLDADPARFCVLDGASALPEWRGHGLHSAAIHERLRHALTLGRPLVGATVSPDNMRSMRGLFGASFEVHHFAIIYGGLTRLIMKRNLAAERQAWEREIGVRVTDHTGHRSALAAGLIGYALVQDGQGAWSIEYGFPSTED